MMVGESSGSANHRGLFIHFDKTDAIYQNGELMTGAVSLELQEEIDIVGEWHCSVFIPMGSTEYFYRSPLGNKIN